jgi:hypothetical protein
LKRPWKARELTAPGPGAAFGVTFVCPFGGTTFVRILLASWSIRTGCDGFACATAGPKGSTSAPTTSMIVVSLRVTRLGVLLPRIMS